MMVVQRRQRTRFSASVLKDADQPKNLTELFEYLCMRMDPRSFESVTISAGEIAERSS